MSIEHYLHDSKSGYTLPLTPLKNGVHGATFTMAAFVGMSGGVWEVLNLD